jgi:hypothetical protein
MSVEEWMREEFRKGVYDDFVVYGIRDRGPRGEVGWHTTSWPNANPVHDFFVIDGEFHSLGGNLFDPQFGYRHSFLLGGIVEVADAERQSVLKAIRAWEEIESVIEDEVHRLPSTAHSAFDGEPNDLTIGADGNPMGVRAPGNPEDRFD